MLEVDMQIEDVLNKLKELGGQSSYSFSDKSAIATLYQEVLDKTFVRTSCGDCYHDAVIEMYLYLKKHGKMKEKSNYALKNGVLLQMGFGSSEMYTNANLTDEVAERYLAKNPENIKYFSKYPEDWKERAEQVANPFPKIDDNLLNELVSALKVEGATVTTVKDVFKGYKLKGKKISTKVLNAHIERAQKIITEDKQPQEIPFGESTEDKDSDNNEESSDEADMKE